MREHSKTSCSTSQYITITEFMWGRSGNHMISFSHGLWFANKFNATLIVPSYMHNLFEVFNTSLAQSLYCYTLQPPKGNNKLIEITSEDMFFGFKVYQDDRWKSMLGPFTDATRVEISRHFLRVYASLWSNPHENIIRAATHLITNHLDGNFQFSSVHIRHFEGGCSKVMGHVTKPSDFSDKEMPMDAPEWRTVLTKWHPLCDMEYQFVNGITTMHKRNASKLFVAHDTRGNIGPYQEHNAVFSSNLQVDDLKAGYDIKFLDMYMCMQSDFFVMNPRSTFSLQIMVVRLILGLTSVPTLRNNDIFVQKVPEELERANRTLWITWDSMMTAIVTDI